MKIKEIIHTDGTCEYHAADCSHRKSDPFADVYRYEIEASSIEDLCHKLELELNADYASDHDMTVEDYVAQKLGWVIGTTKDFDHRVFPCIKF